MKLRPLALAAFTGLSLAATSAQAASIAIDNHSFEDDIIVNPGDAILVATGWTRVGDPGTGKTSAAQYPDGIPDGVNYAWTNFAGEALRQTLTVDLESNTTYTLTVATGWRADLGGSFPNYPGYRIELWAGGAMLGFDADTTMGGTGTGPSVGTWKDVTVTYTSGNTVDPGQALEIRLLGGNNVNGGNAVQTNYDQVLLDATLIPEPSAMALLGLGGLALLSRRRRRAEEQV